jgi:plastocyanin
MPMRNRPLIAAAERRRRTLRVCVCVGLLCAVPAGAAARLQVQVLAGDGTGVPEVVVYAVPVGGNEAAGVGAGGDSGEPAASAGDGPATKATMNQIGLAFDPHVLVVETGTEIEFPNGDEVRHHVYSFSRARRFDLTIDSGSIHSEPLRFDVPGLVTLGCNIHDNMLAYILVVDTPLFAQTDGDGRVALPAPDGRYEIHVWTPRLPDKSLPAPISVELGQDGGDALSFRFDKKLYPPHEHSATSLHWPHY